MKWSWVIILGAMEWMEWHGRCLGWPQVGVCLFDRRQDTQDLFWGWISFTKNCFSFLIFLSMLFLFFSGQLRILCSCGASQSFDTSLYSLCFLNPPVFERFFERFFLWEILSEFVMEEEITTEASTNTCFFFLSFYIRNVFLYLTEKFLRQGIEFWDYFSSTTDSSTGSGYDVTSLVFSDFR